MKKRHESTIGVLTEDELAVLCEKRVFIAGCGGLGGYILEMLARLGIKNITVADGDTFTESNLNRQLLCTEKNLGQKKIEAAIQRVMEINSEVKLQSHDVRISEENAGELLKNYDVIIDALDNVPSRLLLEKYAEILNIPLIHGAVSGWFAQIAVIMPGDKTLEKLYGSHVYSQPPVPSFTPAFCASMQVSQAVKLLSGKKPLEQGKILVFDLYDNSSHFFVI